MKFSSIVEDILDRVGVELQREHNKHKINEFIVEPIIQDISSKLQPIFYLILILYLMLFIPMVIVLIFVLIKRHTRE
jgi:hypothetical protein